MSKPVILTGLRANNDLHIGNYFGALLPLIDMAKAHADEYEVNLFVPDLHSFTTPIDHTQLQAQIMHNLRLFVAAGLPLDNLSVHIYRQSYVPAHSELTVILNSFTGMGQMERMTQYKDKSSKLGSESVSVGLFDYPVLMAADILLYGAKYVPVGDDQSQHLEFTRDIAERMNSKFEQELFTIPEPVAKQHEFFQGLHSFSAEGDDDQPSPRLRPAGQGLRIKDLQDPTKKMSKSDESGKGIIFLGDDPDEAAKKIMSAATDSVGAVHLDYEKQPGISNLLQLHASLSDETLEKVAKHHDGQQSYGDLKKEVAEQVYEFLAEFQERLAAVDDAALMQKLESDERAMNEIANATLLRVQKAVGLRPSSS
jgi:tryptophanyl-tRNA synthetase